MPDADCRASGETREVILLSFLYELSGPSPPRQRRVAAKSNLVRSRSPASKILGAQLMGGK